MSLIVAIIFWGSLALTAYVYLLYPPLLWLLSQFFRTTEAGQNKADPNNDRPLISLVIPAHHEEKEILQRVENALLADYPVDRIEVIVGCDTRHDLTDDLVETLNDPRVRLIRSSVAKGESAILNECIARAQGQIIILSDAKTRFTTATVRRLVRHFRRPQVGAVCGRLQFDASDGAPDSGRLRSIYEHFLQRCELKLGSLPDFARNICAFRKEVYQPFEDGAEIDVVHIAACVQRSGFRLVYDERAIAHTRLGNRRWSEAKPRPATPGLPGGPAAPATQSAFVSCKLRRLRLLLKPSCLPLAFVVFSSRVLQRFTPLFLVGAMLGNAILAGDPFYLRILLLHELVYLAVLVRLCVDTVRRPRHTEERLQAAKRSPVGLFVG